VPCTHIGDRGTEMSDDSELPHAVIIDLRGAETSINEEQDDLSLLIDDGDSATVLVTGAARHSDDAIKALDQLAEKAARLAALLRVRRGDARVFDGPEDEPAALVEPPVNASGW
jgi:hypothetical protein